MADDLKTKIVEEIKKTGFPLELRTAEYLRANGYYVAHSVYFIDKDENKGREIDIRALRNVFFKRQRIEHGVRHVLTIECKKSLSRPWVFFCSEPVSYDQDVADVQVRGHVGSWIQGSIKQYHSFQRGHPWFSRDIRGRAFFEAFSGGNEANATIVKALLGTVKALLAIRDSGFGSHRSERQPNIGFYYPIVVLDGDLFAATLRGSNLHVEPIDSVPVSINYRSPSYTDEERFTVLVTKESALPRELRALDRWQERVAAHLKKHPEVFDITPEPDS
jgi:hypothetical protein